MKIRLTYLLSAGEVESGQQIPVRLPNENIVFLSAADPQRTVDYGVGVVGFVDTEVGAREARKDQTTNELKAERILRVALQKQYDDYVAAHP